MATPNWDQLHLRFAAQIRDSVSTASTAGAELSVADRDAYLNSAFTEYVRLVAMYNPDSLNRILPELFQVNSVNHVVGVITLPADFGYHIDLSQAGSVVTKLDMLDWIKFIDQSDVQSPPTPDNIYYTIAGSILLRPLSASPTFDISYIQSPQSIVQGGSSDIPLRYQHYDTIVSLAKVMYYRDKNEFEVAQSFEQTAIANSPFKIGEIKR